MSGWVVTDKCKELKEYKEAQEKEIKLIEECFGKEQ